MLVLITYDVNTETDAGKKRLRKVAKQCTNYGRRCKILYSNVYWIMHSVLY